MSLNSTAGDAAAESYFAVADADTYFTNRNNAAWTGSTAVKEAAARLGTQYLDNAYRERWKGITATKDQALAWPRVEGSRGGRPFYGSSYPLLDENGWQIDPTVVPIQVQRAAMEAALLSLSGATLEPQLVRGGQIKSLDEQVGPIKESTVWADGAPAIDRYTVIEGYLRGLTDSQPGTSAGNIRLMRG
jgi:hypothetical protein